MKTQTKNMDSEFHAVDFMRQVRSELSKKYLQDKEQYLQDLKKAMEDFKRKQEKANSQQCIAKSGADEQRLNQIT